MRLSRLHAGAVGASPSIHTSRPGEENRDGARPHPRARRTSSDDNSCAHAVMPESRITTIPELTESFEKRLSLGKKNNVSMNETDSWCLICHEDLRSGRAGELEVHCPHRFHREAWRRLEHGRPRSSSVVAECDAWRRAQDECRRSSKETDCLTPQRQFSMRRHR